MDLLIITDHSGHFHCHHSKDSLNVEVLTNGFKKEFKKVEVISFTDIIKNRETLKEIKGKKIIYTSVEHASEYKDMIKEIMYILNKNNDIFPKYDVLMSHENKVFQEYYKDILDINSIGVRIFNNFLEYLEEENELNYPLILKFKEGSGSTGVSKVDNKYDVYKKCFPIMIQNIKNNINGKNNKRYVIKVKLFNLFLKMLPTKISFKYFTKIYKTIFTNDCSFVLQEFKSGFECDYKVLVYYDHLFALKRMVRSNDFRASGSGKFSPGHLPDYVLEKVYNVYKKLDMPIGSFDILIDEEQKDILFIEWQGIHHGPATLELTDHYYEKNGKKFKKIYGNKNIEEEFVYAYSKYVKKK